MHHSEVLGDGPLLERFIAARDETAFATLLRRHGPMVRAVCSRLLADRHEADDAFQATFLVLVKKASTIQKQSSVASWLFGVARRVARHVRLRRGRLPQARSAAADVVAAERQPELDIVEPLLEEIARLPERYRQPVVLCYLEGHTLDHAARRLGWPKGSVAGRLARAKELLRRRLTRRGLGAAALAGIQAAPLGEASASLPKPLMAATISAAHGVLAGTNLSNIPVSVLVLMNGALKAMTLKTTLAWFSLAFLALLTSGAAYYLSGAVGGEARFTSAPVMVDEPGTSGQEAPTARRAAGQEAVKNETATWLIFGKGDERKAVRGDGKEVIELKPVRELRYDQSYIGTLHRGISEETPINGALSPDGKKLALVGDIKDGKAVAHPFHGYSILANPDGSEPKLLTPAKLNRRSLTWSPDGKRLAWHEATEKTQKLENRAKGGFDYGAEALRRVVVLDLATGRTLFTFGGASESIHSPQFTPRGRLSYLVTRARNGKILLEDLIVRILDGVMSADALRPHTVVNEEWILGFAFSPDESRLAYSRGSEMVVKNLEKAGLETFKLEALNQHLGKQWSVCFLKPVWRADGKALACRCAFMGGRMAGDESPIPGEEQVMIFPADENNTAACEPETFAFDRNWSLLRWATFAEVQRLKK
jgi:RNA polymerase sigma factor (sigma-70 family)